MWSNGNPLQCSCLENPSDGGAWWAAIFGIAQSQTRLKRPSSQQQQQCILDGMKGKADLVALEVCSVAGCFELTLWPSPQECITPGFSAHLAASFSQHFRNSGAALRLFVMYEFIFFEWWTVFKFFLNKVDLKTAKFFETASWFCWAPFRFLVANGQGKPRKIVWKDTETLKMPYFPSSAVSYYIK